MWPFSKQKRMGRKAFTITKFGGANLSDGDITITENSAIASVAGWCVRAIGEPSLRVMQKDKEQDGHPVAILLANPNPWMDGAAFRAAITASLVFKGNAYILQVYGVGNQPAELWPLMPTQVTLERDINGIPKCWRYRGKEYPLDQIIHIKDGINPNDFLLGWSGLDSVIREVATDNEATIYTEAILKNLGVPGMIVSLKPGDANEGYDIDPEVGQSIKDWAKRAFSGKARGETIVVTMPIDVNMPQVSPDKMALEQIRRIPERRICSVIGIPPIVAGLGEDPKYDNYRAAREAAYESWAVPMWRTIARGLNTGLAGLLKGAEIDFDLAPVRALQEDADAIAERSELLYDGDIITKNESREMNGFDKVPDGDKFKSEGSAGRTSTLRAMRDKKRSGRASTEATE